MKRCCRAFLYSLVTAFLTFGTALASEQESNHFGESDSPGENQATQPAVNKRATIFVIPMRPGQGPQISVMSVAPGNSGSPGSAPLGLGPALINPVGMPSGAALKAIMFTLIAQSNLPAETQSDLTRLIDAVEAMGMLRNPTFFASFLSILQTLHAEFENGTAPEEESGQRLEPGWFGKYNSCELEHPGMPPSSGSAPVTPIGAAFLESHGGAQNAPLPEMLRLFDTSRTFEFSGRDWYPSTDNPEDSAADFHGLSQWEFFCFGNRAECFPIQATPLQYGCGGIRARILAKPDTALFDSPKRPLSQRRLPGLVR